LTHRLVQPEWLSRQSRSPVYPGERLFHAHLLARDTSTTTQEQVDQARQVVEQAMEDMIRGGQLDSVRYVWRYDRLAEAGCAVLASRFPHLGFFLRRSLAIQAVRAVYARCLSWLPPPEQEWQDLLREEEAWSVVSAGSLTVEGLIDHFRHRVSAVPFNREVWAVIDLFTTTDGITPALRAEAREWWWFFTLFCPSLANSALEWRTLLDLSVAETRLRTRRGHNPADSPNLLGGQGLDFGPPVVPELVGLSVPCDLLVLAGGATGSPGRGQVRVCARSRCGQPEAAALARRSADEVPWTIFAARGYAPVAHVSVFACPTWCVLRVPGRAACCLEKGVR